LVAEEPDSVASLGAYRAEGIDVVGDRREQRSRSGIDQRISILAAEILRLEDEIHRWSGYLGFSGNQYSKYPLRSENAALFL
jgi:hypothetical protein